MAHIQSFFSFNVAKLSEYWSSYASRRMLFVLLLGFSAGLPLALSGDTLKAWMTDEDVDIATIGFFSLVGLPYALKFLWAPLVDTFKIPFLHPWLGQRRSWLLLTQFLLIGSIVFLGTLNPAVDYFSTACVALAIATISATQDIVIDAFRIESLDEHEQNLGATSYVTAYRLAMLTTNGGVLYLVHVLEQAGLPNHQVWFYGYLASGLLVLIGVAATLFSSEPKRIHELTTDDRSHNNAVSAYWTALFQALSAFLLRPQALFILLFIVLYKFCDALAGAMTTPFVLKIGFSKAELATIVKLVGTSVTIMSAILAGALIYRMSIYKALWIAIVVQMLSNLMFVWQAWIGPEQWALVLTVVVENFTGSIGTIVFVSYISILCGATQHTATQYALLTALASVGRTVLSSFSGVIAEPYGWSIFFIITTLVALPSLFLLIYLNHKGHFQTLHYEK